MATQSAAYARPRTVDHMGLSQHPGGPGGVPPSGAPGMPGVGGIGLRMGGGAPSTGFGAGTMPSGTSLGSSGSSGFDARALVGRMKKLRKAAAPYVPTLVRLLLVATFVEDGVRVLFEMPHQIEFLRIQYYVPHTIGLIMLVSNVFISFVGVALVVAQKKAARGAYETHGSYLLLGCVVYQQILYGRHSPIGSGNWGFLVRNLCLAGSLILVSCQVRLAAGQSALPLGLLDGRSPTKRETVSYMQLASRMLLVLLSMEFIATMGVVGVVLTVPVVIAVMVGFHLEISGSILLLLYFLHNLMNSSFWAVNGSYMREIMRYEFVQTLSIMGGLLLMISLGPGALSVDEMRGRKAF